MQRVAVSLLVALAFGGPVLLVLVLFAMAFFVLSRLRTRIAL